MTRSEWVSSYPSLPSLRTIAELLLQLLRDRCCLESSHWICETQFQEDGRRYRDNGFRVMSTLRRAVMNLLRLLRFQAIRAGMHVVRKHNPIKVLLAMVQRQPNP